MDPLFLLVADMNTLDAMRCQRQILDVCWWVHVSNAEVFQRPGLSTVCQPLVTSYVIDAYLSVWPCCTPGSWSTSK